MKKVLSLILLVGTSHFIAAQNVGIGTSTPDYKVDIVGSIRASSNAFFDAVGIGTTTIGISEKLRLSNGGIGLFNTTDTKTWVLNYSSANDHLFLSENGTTRIVVENGGNVGIGSIAPAFKLDVTGSGRFTDNLTIDDNLIVNDNVTVDNNLTVDGGKGIIRNSTSTQLRYETFKAPFAMNLPGHGSLTANIVWNAFSAPPVAYVANIVTSGGTTGELYRCILQLYNVTATGCDCKIINTSSNPVYYNCTWNIVLIGK